MDLGVELRRDHGHRGSGRHGREDEQGSRTHVWTEGSGWSPESQFEKGFSVSAIKSSFFEEGRTRREPTGGRQEKGAPPTKTGLGVRTNRL